MLYYDENSLMYDVVDQIKEKVDKAFEMKFRKVKNNKFAYLSTRYVFTNLVIDLYDFEKISTHHIVINSSQERRTIYVHCYIHPRDGESKEEKNYFCLKKGRALDRWLNAFLKEAKVSLQHTKDVLESLDLMNTLEGVKKWQSR